MYLGLLICLFVTVRAHDTFVFLRHDCRVYIVGDGHYGRVGFDVLPPSHTKCEGAEIIHFIFNDVNYFFMASFLSEKSLTMAIEPLNHHEMDELIELKTDTVDFDHVLGTQCRFDKKYFAAGIFSRIMYFVAVCDDDFKTFALARGVLGIDGQWYIPHGPLIYFERKLFKPDGVIFWKLAYNVQTDFDHVNVVFYAFKSNNADKHHFESHPLHEINSSFTKEFRVRETDNIVHYYSTSGEAFSWNFVDKGGCMSVFVRPSYTMFNTWGTPINVPCTYKAQQITHDNQKTKNISLTNWKFVDAASKSTYDCRKFSKKIGKGKFNCTNKTGIIILSVIIGIEVLIILGIGITSLVLFLKQKLPKRLKKMKANKSIKKSIKESERESSIKKVVKKPIKTVSSAKTV